jgi:ribosomal protein L11 methyltransferase
MADSVAFNNKAGRRRWYAVDIVIDEIAREAVEYALMEAGSLGTEYSDNDLTNPHVTGYFDDIPNRENLRSELVSALQIYSLPTANVRDMQFRELEDQDWLAEWKKSWQPVAVGRRFIIAPPWSQIPDERGRIVIRIEPGMAFGTGTHETTRLCLAAIERYFEGGSLLDVGTGTGILAIAAAKIDPTARILACDTDVAAVAIAEENARLNDVHNVALAVGSIAADSTSADCVCANLTTDVILELLPHLLVAACRRLILSGILATQLNLIVDALQQQGVSSPLATEVDGEWACVIV